MGLNIEIKARCNDLQKIEKIIIEKNWPLHAIEIQKDTFFNVPAGRLKLREINNERAVLIPYFRPDSDKPREAEYVLLPVNEAEQTIKILKEMFGIRQIVEKKRMVYLYENVRIHLDRVDSLGTFIELEGVIKKAEQEKETHTKLKRLMDLFGINQQNIIKEAYIDMLKKGNK